LLFFKVVQKVNETMVNETMVNIALGAALVSGMSSTLSYYFGASKAATQNVDTLFAR
jgi:hypothetical protein